MAEVLGLVLEADPLLRADRIRPRCEGRVLDAWSLFGVDRVVNRLQVTD